MLTFRTSTPTSSRGEDGAEPVPPVLTEIVITFAGSFPEALDQEKFATACAELEGYVCKLRNYLAMSCKFRGTGVPFHDHDHVWRWMLRTLPACMPRLHKDGVLHIEPLV